MPDLVVGSKRVGIALDLVVRDVNMDKHEKTYDEHGFTMAVQQRHSSSSPIYLEN